MVAALTQTQAEERAHFEATLAEERARFEASQAEERARFEDTVSGLKKEAAETLSAETGKLHSDYKARLAESAALLEATKAELKEAIRKAQEVRIEGDDARLLSASGDSKGPEAERAYTITEAFRRNRFKLSSVNGVTVVP